MFQFLGYLSYKPVFKGRKNIHYGDKRVSMSGVNHLPPGNLFACLFPYPL